MDDVDVKVGNLSQQEVATSNVNRDEGENLILYKIRNAGRIFDDKDGVQIDELDIPAGQMIAILGESGSGKSTLLNLLGNLVQGHRIDPEKKASLIYQTVRRKRFWRGGVKICSQELVPSNFVVRFWNELREYFPWPSSTLIRKEAGYVFQEAYLLKNATVSVNLALPIRLRSMWSWVINTDRIEHIARHLDQDSDGGSATICGKLSKRSWPLSGGQAQRVAVGRAIVRNPSIILADEPTASLDPELGESIIAMLRKWQKASTPESPRSVIWATHNMEHAASFADKIIILRNGNLIEIPEHKEFRKKYGRTWPLKNPHDHELIKELLRGQAGGLNVDMVEIAPAAEQDIVDMHLHQGKQLVDEAPDLSPAQGKLISDHKERNWPNFSIGILFRVAISEVFNHKNVDRGIGTRFLRSLTSVTADSNSSTIQHADHSWWHLMATFTIAMLGVSLIAAGVIAENGGIAQFGDVAHGLVQKTSDLWESFIRLALGKCPECAGYIPTTSTNSLWVSRSAIVLGSLAIVYLLFHSYWRSVGNKWEFLIYFLILIFLAGAFKGYGVIEDVFKARFKSPELGNTVIEARSLHRKLNDENLVQLDKTLMALSFTPPAMTSVGNITAKTPQFAFGRYQNVDVTIGRLPKGWKPVSNEQVPEWGDLGAGQEKTQKSLKECSTDAGGKEGELLAIDMGEPMVASLPFVEGNRLSTLSRVSYEGKERKNSEGVWGIYLTRKMLRKLGYRTDEDGNNGNLIDTHFCMDLYGEKIVRLAGIIDRLPNDTTSDYNILIDKGLYRSAYRNKKDKKLANFDKVTLYIDPDQPAKFIHTVECASSAGYGLIAECSPDLNLIIKEHLDYAFRVEGGFDKIKQAISLGAFFKKVSVGILVAFLFLAALLTLKISTSYILQNERSLCVMRAFGASVWQILYLILLQFTIILLPGLAMGSILAFYIWPTVGEPMALILNVDSDAVLFSSKDAVNILSIVGSTLLFGCILAVFGWWSGSRWIAERLKQVG